MKEFTLQDITALIIVIGVLIFVCRWFRSYCDRVDAEWAARNLDVALIGSLDIPNQADIAAAHVAKRRPACERTRRFMIGSLIQMGHDHGPRS